MYELSIESRHGDFYGKRLQKFKVDGHDTVGAFGNEPFAVVFRNGTHSRVAARVSIDGADVLTGEPANLSTSGRKWIVDPHDSLVIHAWPESKDGGAAFVFADEGHSVAAHTHGDASHIGWIAVAVFVEGAPGVTRGSPRHGLDLESLRSKGGPESRGSAVGAGSYAEQKIQTVTGLREPRFAEIVRVRHMWWDDLKEKLSAPAPRVTGPVWGFPGATEEPFKGINLGGVPRVDTFSRFA